MGTGLGLLVADLEVALALPAGSVTSAGSLSNPRPKVRVQIGTRLLVCGVARGLSANDSPHVHETAQPSEERETRERFT
jgi:hypothetical protein|tara:strand:- start:45 stop:281 length:237 start_codon:yes stop_codon:yes gene_type:complete